MGPGQCGSPPGLQAADGWEGMGPGAPWLCWGRGSAHPLSTFLPLMQVQCPGPPAPVRWESRWGVGASQT